MPEGFIHDRIALSVRHAEGLPETPLGLALRSALRGASGRVVLRVSDPAPHRRRVARLLLQEGALTAGGQVVEGPEEDLLLVGAEAARAERLRPQVERLLSTGATGIWSLERDALAMLAYAAGAAPLPPRPAPVGPELARLDDWLARLPLPPLVRRQRGRRLGEGNGPNAAFLRLEVARADLAALLGTLGTDADLLDHAAQMLQRRLLLALDDPRERRILLGRERPGRLHLALPPVALAGGGSAPPGRNRLIATLALAEVADLAALAARRAALAAAGWMLELDGLDAASLPLLDTGKLPADLLRLHWSPALEGHDAAMALRRVDPARLVLAGAESPAASDWARRVGVAWVEEPAVPKGVIAA